MSKQRNPAAPASLRPDDPGLAADRRTREQLLERNDKFAEAMRVAHDLRPAAPKPAEPHTHYIRSRNVS